MLTAKHFIIIIFTIWTILFIYEMMTYVNFNKIVFPERYKIKQYDENIKNNLNENEYNGYLTAKKSKIVICTLARNNSKAVDDMKVKMETIGKYFHEYKIVIFENDSSDNTRELLIDWTKQNNNVKLLNCCNLGNCDCKLKTKTGYQYGAFSENRLEKMAKYRQQYLDFVLNEYFYYDYMLVVDFDLNGVINIEGLFDSIAKPDWGAIFCNGRTPLPGTFGFCTFPYDSFAFVKLNDNYDKLYNSKNMLELLKNNLEMDFLLNDNNFAEVNSAFNGYGIYKIKCLDGCSYIGNNKICEHINLAKQIKNKNHKIFINSKWQGYFDKQGDAIINLIIDLFKQNK